MSEPEHTDASDSRPARREAIEAALLGLAALILTVGLSTWLNSMSTSSLLGIPRWAAFGVFAPWLLFFVLHVRYCLKHQARRDKS